MADSKPSRRSYSPHRAPERFFAHSAGASGEWELLAHHLTRVSERAAEFAEMFGAAKEARLVGLLHDLGKYGALFQKRLRGLERGIDHWSAGAWVALMKAEQCGLAAALAIQGHHIGLQKSDKDALSDLDPASATATRAPVRASETDVELLKRRFHSEGLTVSPLHESVCAWGRKDRAAAMLDVRMLFSCLVDADYLETEAHFGPGPGKASVRPTAPPLAPEKALPRLESHLRDLVSETNAAEEVMRLRADLLAACETAADMPPGLFTLSAPTGSGKTLSMLAFALRHAVKHRLRRVVFVVPYLSIIEQTAQTYRHVLGEGPGSHYFIEGHSLAGFRSQQDDIVSADLDNDNARLRATRLLAENWDAPIVITTSVRFLESLFSNRPRACRKLHNLARSVILFDEVQTLPAQLAAPTLATLSRLSERYGASIVFATATQPAFSHLDAIVRELGSAGWRPTEVVPPDLNLFARSRRTRIQWPEDSKPTAWTDLAQSITEQRQALCVVNLKSHARELCRMLATQNPDGLFHLSTSMCPTHRQRVLAEVRRRLDADDTCRLISTQCVEAGVDVDFPAAFRAWGPLEAIAQAAGRCNRNGRLSHGEVRVFLPAESRYPTAAYAQAADVALALLKSRGPERMDICDPSVFGKYYRSLYDLTAVAHMEDGKGRKIREAIERGDFAAVAALYRLIEKDSVNVLVPFDVPMYEQLAAEVRKDCLSADWIRRARPHTVTLFRSTRKDERILSFLEPAPLTPRDDSDDWYICTDAALYDRDLLGLLPPEDASALLTF